MFADFLYQLKQKNDIVTVISRYVRLDQKGAKYWGCCPFHNEKTPSFAVSREDGFYHCFGCKEHGDVISFVQKMESCEFMDAVKILAEQAHMEIPQIKTDDQTHHKVEQKQRLLSILEDAWKHYHENLYQPIAKPAQDYIKLRAFTRRELEDFKLGYSVNGYELIDYLRSKGHKDKDLIDAGIAQEKDGRIFDTMAARLTFPIFNSFNECVGFSARALEKTDFAKYKNTSETPVFQKRKVVFGINLLKAQKQAGKLDKIIIVEGQIDVIAMHRAGFKTTVACMGSALTADNVNILKKLSHNFVLCFDGDGAGQKATIKSLDVLGDDINVSIVALPDGQDPDEVIKNKGKEYLGQLIDNALPVMDYLIAVETKNFNLSSAQERGQFAKACLMHLLRLKSDAQREPYLEKIRDLSNVPIENLRADLTRFMSGQQPSINQDKKDENSVLIARENGNIRGVKFVLASLIHQMEYVDKKIDYIKLLPQYKDIIEKAKNGLRISSYYDYFDVENIPVLSECITMDFAQYKPSPEMYFKQTIWMLAEDKLKAKQMEITKEFSSCNDITQRKEIMMKLNLVTKQIREKSLEDFYVR